MSVRLCFFIALFQLTGCLLHAQSTPPSVTTLKGDYKRATNDSQRLEILKQLFAYYRPIDVDSAQIILDLALPIARRSKDTKTEVFLLTKQGIMYRMNKANPKTGLAVYFQALQLAEAISDSAAFSDIYYGIGRIQDDQQNKEEAVKAFLTAIQTAKTGVALYNGLESLAVHYANNKNLTEAEKYFKKAENLVIGSADLANYRLRLFSNLGEFYSQYKQDTTKSISYFRRAAVSAVTNPQTDLTRYLVETKGLAVTLLNLKDYKNCISLCHNIVVYRNNHKHNIQLAVAYAYHLMFKAYKALGNYRQAAIYADSAQVLSDTLTRRTASENIKKETYKLEATFNLERKQKEVEFLAQKQKTQQLWVWTAILVAVLLSVFSWIVYRNRQNLAKQKVELTHLNTTKDKLFAILSHDLRSPVGALENTLMLTNWGALSQTEFTETTQQLSQRVSQVRTMLDNLLQWSISQMGGIKPIKEQIRLLELLESQIQVLSPASTKKSIQIINTVSDDATLLADKNHLAVIVRNLLQNAIKFTHSGGSISIKANRQQDKLLVEISDTGIGMSKERLANLFRLSTASSKLGTDLEQGTGLGLVLVKELVEANEGSIEVNSEPNQGTLFKLYFRTSPAAALS